DSLASVLRGHVEVFEVDARVTAPGGVVVEVEGEAGRSGGACFRYVGDDAVEAFGGAEAVAEQVGFGGEDGVGLALVGGEVADEGEDLGDVGGGSGAEVEGCWHEEVVWLQISCGGGWGKARGGRECIPQGLKPRFCE